MSCLSRYSIYPVYEKTVAPLFVYPPDNLTVFPVDTKGRYRGFAGLWRLYRDMKSQGIDAIADLHNVLRTRVVGFFLRFRASNE